MVGIGGQIVEYDFGDNRIIDGDGGDFNVYEANWGGAEFSLISVFVSLDGENYYDVTASEAAAVVDLNGDESWGTDFSFARSYDLSGSSLSEARFIKIDGNGEGLAGGCCTGFDLDAVGGVNYVVAAVPEVSAAGALAALGSLLAMMAFLWERRRLPAA
ncbi:hypothetical protein C1J05_06150 [Sulfitobacter sp. JL08]|nr:hypothetical protein C1J05_06150 [Sulfitobacter sp. JL08]